MDAVGRSTSGRGPVRPLDVAIAVWTVAWIVLAVVVGREIASLTQLSDTVVSGGEALRETASALRTLEGLPLVGPRVGDLAQRIDRAGTDAVESGRESRRNITRLSILLPLPIALVPTIPLLALYVPVRLRTARRPPAVPEDGAGARG